MSLSDDVKAGVSLVELAGEVVAWDRRKSAAARGEWWAPCPFHAEKTASFHVTEPEGTGGVWHCFGCNEGGSAIDFVAKRDGVGFVEAVRTLADRFRIGRERDPDRIAAAGERARERRREADEVLRRTADDRERVARQIWDAARPDAPELGRYLAGRGVRLRDLEGIPPTLRFHADLPCRNPDGEIVHRGPAMVAFIGRVRFLGVHRTWIDGEARARLPDGSKVPKQMLGRTGELFGAPCRLSRSSRQMLVVGEGIETTLAAFSVLRMAAGGDCVSAEAALTLGALAGPENPIGRGPGPGANGRPLPSALPDFSTDRPGWVPPPDTRRVVILGDPSRRDPKAAERHAWRAHAKVAAIVPDRDAVRLAVPRGSWAHDLDFADLAKLGEF
jgi:hypothetical protein